MKTQPSYEWMEEGTEIWYRLYRQTGATGQPQWVMVVSFDRPTYQDSFVMPEWCGRAIEKKLMDKYAPKL